MLYKQLLQKHQMAVGKILDPDNRRPQQTGPAPWSTASLHPRPVNQPCGVFFLNTKSSQPRIARHLKKVSKQNTEPKLGVCKGGEFVAIIDILRKTVFP